ncbi:hypothetical protein E1180_18505 [Roseibium denhamense]|uniref:Uncharacterized protein n=1 Tax=Roseibium denhamense TaxID=76305 RepID=A0ABY1PCD6_9HYPH|nr:hypothetical protein [Roseibium denhamense]MTI07495.1 hypothetical protein [Roseibium denhamense]SMP30032.1 hypothetical protein SAMN06265374_3191 [Roseibium denhamense]
MKAIVSSTLFLIASTQMVEAGPCADKFIALFTQPDQGVATKTLATTEFKGAPPMTNEFHFLSLTHNMTVPISPPQPWVMTYETVMYQSSDKGNTWTKVRDLEAPAPEAVLEQKLTDAQTLRNTDCALEEIDGVAYERIAGDITLSQGMVTENRYTYFVRQSDGFIAKAIYDTKAPNFEMVITQEIEPAPDLQLPVPD